MGLEECVQTRIPIAMPTQDPTRYGVTLPLTPTFYPTTAPTPDLTQPYSLKLIGRFGIPIVKQTPPPIPQP